MSGEETVSEGNGVKRETVSRGKRCQEGKGVKRERVSRGKGCQEGKGVKRERVSRGEETVSGTLFFFGSEAARTIRSPGCRRRWAQFGLENTLRNPSRPEKGT